MKQIMGLHWGTFLCGASVLLYPVCCRIITWSTRKKCTADDIFFVDNGDTLPANFNFNRRDFVEGRVLHSAQGRCVLEATWNGIKVVVKKFTAKSTSLSVMLMAREATYLLRLRHPNVLHLYGYYFEARRDVILSSSMVMERMDWDLQKYIDDVKENRQGLPFKEKGVYVMAQIARGMQHVHCMGYCHRDLKAANVLVRESGAEDLSSRPEVKIADFGSSEIMRDKHSSDPNAGTLHYKAPEQLPTISPGRFSVFYHMCDRWMPRMLSKHLLPNSPQVVIPAKTDVFSFGALCCKILTGKDPYSDQTPLLTPQHIRDGNTPTIPDGDHVPEEIRALIRKCLARNPVDRPDFQYICEVLNSFVDVLWREALDNARVAEVDGSAREVRNERERELERRMEHILDMGVSEKNFERDESKIKMWGKIGQGTDAIVYNVEWQGMHYAGRCVPVSNEGDEQQLLIEQIAMLPKLKHKNIVEFFGFGSRKRRRELLSLMELMEMDLGQLTLMRSRGGYWEGKRFTRPYDNETSRKIMINIAAGMEYLHAKDVWHGDLHCSNILILHKPGKRCSQKSSRVTCFPPFRGHPGCLKGMIVKLSDYRSNPLRCAYDYAAPELVKLQQTLRGLSGIPEDRKLQFFKKCDVYSFAVVFYQILSGNFPLDTVVRMTCRDRKTTICEGVRPQLPEDIDEDVKQLIHRCWHHDAEQRPEFSEIIDLLSKKP